MQVILGSETKSVAGMQVILGSETKSLAGMQVVLETCLHTGKPKVNVNRSLRETCAFLRVVYDSLYPTQQ